MSTIPNVVPIKFDVVGDLSPVDRVGVRIR
jgi:hypothetical protein